MTENHFTSEGKFMREAYDESISNFPEYEIMDLEEIQMKKQFESKEIMEKKENEEINQKPKNPVQCEENLNFSRKANTNKSLVSIESRSHGKEKIFPSVNKFKTENESKGVASDEDEINSEINNQVKESTNNSNINQIEKEKESNFNNQNSNSIYINKEENTKCEKEKNNLEPFYTKKLDLQDFIQASQNMISDYICELCQGVYWDPHVDGCGHVYCKECFYKFIDSSKKSLCPTTLLEIDLNLVAPIKFVAAILEKQTLRCSHKSCGWLGKLIDLHPHLDSECLFEPVSCPFENCLHRKILRKNITEHQETCDFRPSQCINCAEKLFLGDKNSHKKICKKELIACVQDCGEMVERERETSHIAKECGFSLVTCQYYEFGCEVEIMKKDLKAHLIDKVNYHNLCVCKFLKNFKVNLVSRVESIEKKIQQNNEKFDDIYSFLETDFRKINDMIMKGKKGISYGFNSRNPEINNGIEFVAKQSGEKEKNNNQNNILKENGKVMLGKKKGRSKEKGLENEEAERIFKKIKEEKIITDKYEGIIVINTIIFGYYPLY